MGQNKLPLTVGGSALLDRVLAALATRCDELLVVGGGNVSLGVPAPARRVEDLRTGAGGPLFGMEAAFTHARHRHVFVAAGDMPFLSGELVAYLLGLLDGECPAAVPRLGGREHPLCAAYDARLVLPPLASALDRGEQAARPFLAGLAGVRYVGGKELSRFGEPERLLANVNTPEDLARAREAGG
jgi:molybdopterin-guanine dinucleotide biosynthesis protein A